MQFRTAAIALISALTPAVLAADVYSEFLDSAGAQIGSTNFDVSNRGCFNLSNAVEISFTQGGGTHTANGPYCLSGYPQSNCAGQLTSQEFKNVQLNDGHPYELNEGLASVSSYTWSPDGC